MTTPLRQNREVIIEAPATKLVLDKEFSDTFKAADATPSAKNLTRFKTGNTVANNVTYFDDGQEGQQINVLGDGFTTVVHDTTKIATSTGANKLLSANKVYRFTLYKIGADLVWIEDA